MKNVYQINFDNFGDDRGMLTVAEPHNQVPIDIRRVYWIYATSPEVARGFHAHKKCEQVLVCVAGSCDVILDNGEEKQTVHLNSPGVGLFVGVDIWHEMHNFASNCVLMVMASVEYEESDYLRDYNGFLEFIKND